MTEAGDPAIAKAEINFPARRRASVVFARRDASPADVVRALDVPAPRGVLVLNGGTAGFSPEVEARLAPVLADGVARVATDEGLTTITGATDSGVFALFGAGLENRAAGVRIGVAPAELVTWPGRRSAADDAAPLEPHHSHFVLVDGHEWGDELSTIMRLAALLGAQAPSLAVIAGGGDVTRRELVAHTRAGRDVVVIRGSGGLADEVAAAAAGRASGDREVVEAVGSGHITVLGLEAGPGQLAELIRSRLGARKRQKKFKPPALLKRFPLVPYRLPPDYPFVSDEQRAAAPLIETELTRLDRELVPRFRTLDHEALVAQHRFRLGGVLLIVGSAVAAALGAVQAALGGGVLGIGIAEAIVGAVVAGVVVYMRGRRFQQTYLTKRLQAERLKSQYYLYLARAGSYAEPDDAARAKLLARTLDRIETGGEPG
jgi:SLOG in TRPM, prokaryote/Protein of unknown function (DUF4231)